MNHNEFGKKGELIAAKYLQSIGYKIIETNWKASHTEVDIIAEHENQLVFVEVKTRSYDYYGSPEEFVDGKKQQNLTFAANRYMEKTEYEGEIRFDIIAIIMQNGTNKFNHIIDAFFPGL